MTHAPLHLFQGYGVELEYMIADRETLDIRPISDELIKAEIGAYVSDVERGPIGWSNELVLHVIELKTEGPAPTLTGLAALFQENVNHINKLLEPMGACLLPTAAHPWMNPHTETRLWPHEYNAVYEAYNRIFDCRGHGWSNLQSTHINLPFANDEEFGRLHAAIRLVLPLIPALAASSPLLEYKRTGQLDTRLDCYQKNQARIPSIIGPVVPEPVYTQKDYDEQIFQRTYRDIAPYDPDGILQDEFLNSRGAIARFSRGAIEIRLVDLQECPAADLAIVQTIVALVRAFVDETLLPYEEQKKISSEDLREVLLGCIRDGENATITNRAYLRVFNVLSLPGRSALDLLRALYTELQIGKKYPETVGPISLILERGTLSRRILNALRDDDSPADIKRVYRRLADCLARGICFDDRESI